MAVDTCRPSNERRRFRPLRRDTNAFVCLLSTVCFFAQVANCHVALTYPPARKYDLDFLDNVRTKGPCGMPKGEIRTSLISGAAFNITWHLAYPHQGGFRLELLDHLERSILDLTPKTETSDFVSGDATAQHFELKFPHTFECKDCTIRLIRQANEWSSKYHFWSCADVDIYKRGAKKVDCNGRGNYLGGRCICERLYYGDRCQYADECSTDNDCGRQGVCVDIKATSYPKKQCYCRPGYFGEKCNKKSDIKTLNNINFGAYSKRDLSDKLTMYWRILQASRELEVVLQGNGTSYIALGWKPQGLTTNCRLFPHITDSKPAKAPESAQAESEPEPEAEPAAAATTPAGPKEKAPVPATGRGRPRYRFIDSAPGDAAAAAEPEPAAEKKEEKVRAAEPASAAEPEPAAAEPEPAAAEPEPAAESEPESTTGKPTEAPELKEAADSEPEPEPTTTEREVKTTTAKPSEKKKLAKTTAKTEDTAAAEPEPTSEPEPESNAEPEPTTAQPAELKAEGLPEAAAEPEPAATEAETSEGSTTVEPETTTGADLETTTGAQRRKRQAPKLELEGWRPIASGNPTPIDRRRQPIAEQDYIDRADTGPVEFADQDPLAGGHEHHGTSAAHDHDHPHEHADHSHDHAQPQGDAQAEPEPAAGSEGASAEPESAPEPEADAKPTTPPAAAKPATTENNYAPKGDKKLHAMDCSDIVIGTARGAAHRVEDYYTRDRSTPRVDSFWGFESDLTAAFGFEENGVTTIAFRRKLEANEPTDHSIVDAAMTVIWARGQEPGQYVHSPHSGLEKGAASDPDFYKPDEIKYHGQKDQRGVLSMNFFEEDAKEKSAAASGSDFCGGEFRYPRTCSDPDCEYTARWEYDEGSDSVKFTVTTRHTKNRWTGIGFSKDTRMGQSDAVLGWIDRSGRSFIADWWIKGYQAPELDSNQDISETSVAQEDGVVTLKFTKPRVSKDEQDHSLDQCLHFLFPIKGGDVKAVSKKMGKHDARPEVSAEKICIRSCSAGAGVEGSDDAVDGVRVPVTTARTTTTTTQKPQLLMDVELKVLDVGDNFVVPRKNSPEYKELSDRVKRDIATALTSVPGFEDVNVAEFESSKENELIARLVVTLDHEAVSKEYKGKKQGGESEKAKEMVSKALEDRITTGQIGELRVDPQYLKVGQPIVQKEAASTSWAGLSDSQLKLYIVIGAIGLLVLVALMQASCTIHRLRKKSPGSRSHKEGLITNSAWKDYSAATGSTNYAYEHFDPAAVGDERAGKRGANGTSGRPRGGPPGSGTHQLRNGGGAPGFSAAPYGDSRSLQRAPKNGVPVLGGPKGSDRYTNSLPRPSFGAPSHHPGGYYTHDRSRNSYAGPSSSSSSQAPDFYFMPSQRKYSGEIVRVYVDYNQHK